MVSTEISFFYKDKTKITTRETTYEADAIAIVPSDGFDGAVAAFGVGAAATGELLPFGELTMAVGGTVIGGFDGTFAGAATGAIGAAIGAATGGGGGRRQPKLLNSYGKL
jgi:hypothetical protein